MVEPPYSPHPKESNEKENISVYNNLQAADMQLCSHLNSLDRSEQGSLDRLQEARSDHYTIYNPAASRALGED